MNLSKLFIVLLVTTTFLAGCAGTGSPKTWTPTPQDREKMEQASMLRAMKIQAYPMDADMENFDLQMRLMPGGMYMTWAGEYKQLPAAFEKDAQQPIKPRARYENINAGDYQSLGKGTPVDIMR